MKTTLKIDGMTCDNCVNHVTKALKDVVGVLLAEVTLEDEIAMIEHGDHVTMEILVAAVEEAGYGVVA